MLTKTDLSQIKTIIKDEINPLKEKTEGLDKRLSSVDERLGKVEVELRKVKKAVKKTQKDINIIVDFFDRDYLELKARVERIEGFLKIPPLTS